MRFTTIAFAACTGALRPMARAADPLNIPSTQPVEPSPATEHYLLIATRFCRLVVQCVPGVARHLDTAGRMNCRRRMSDDEFQVHVG
jgi:hypothetical protein